MNYEDDRSMRELNSICKFIFRECIYIMKRTRSSNSDTDASDSIYVCDNCAKANACTGCNSDTAATFTAVFIILLLFIMICYKLAQ